MSKKKKKKFKAQLAQVVKDIDKKNITEIDSNEKKPDTEKNTVEDTASEITYIRRDMKKIVFATAICLLILLIIFYFNQSTDSIKNFSESLISGFHIQI